MARYEFTTRRLYVDAPLAQGARIELERPQAHYLCNVLRLGEGAELLAFNGRDGEWRVALTLSGRKSVALVAKNMTRQQEAPGDLHYLFAPL
jgi:16S rRNA (uracil1498-N3)-methyltransferase